MNIFKLEFWILFYRTALCLQSSSLVVLIAQIMSRMLCIASIIRLSNIINFNVQKKSLIIHKI